MKFPAFLLIALVTLTTARGEGFPVFTVHEWGTWTTVSGSDGVLLPGLQREEEGLPYFVGSHAGMANYGDNPTQPDGTFHTNKGWIRPLKNVTVKMETPVIYFYTNEPFQAQVAVDFHGGSISQWYPPRISGEELPPMVAPFMRNNPADTVDFGKKYEGSIRWDVKVTPPAETDAAAIFQGGETTTWLIPRQTDSALVTTAQGVAEKFLFYRGVGNFAMPVKFSMQDDRILQVNNTGDESLAKLFIYEKANGVVKFTLVDGLAAGESAQIDLSTLTAPQEWQRPVYQLLADALVASGLYRKEADAMLQTWWQSYFQKEGLRVFWIAPSDFTEKILPLSVQPAPQKTVRVLVGRSEILTPSFEQALLKEKKDPNTYVNKNDRFLEAYATRLQQLADAQSK